jgi:hypothetical protein
VRRRVEARAGVRRSRAIDANTIVHPTSRVTTRRLPRTNR